MTRAEWDQAWWDEFKKLRKQFPTEDLIKLQKATTTYMNKRFGPPPEEEKELGPPLLARLVALAVGVPMGFLTGLWTWLNGKKTVIGSIITAVGVAATYLPPVLAFFGVEAVHITTVIGIATMVVGALHKAYKLIYKEELPEKK